MHRLVVPFTVHDAQVAVWHAWRDGMPVSGPMPRHLGMVAEFRAGLTISPDGDGAADGVTGFGDWRMNGGAAEGVAAGGWAVEFSVPLAAAADEGAEVAALGFLPPGAPVVVVARFRDKATGLWRTLQFHDAEVLPVTAAEDAQRMMRTVRVRAGWMEEFKAGTMPGMAPRMVGVLEWRHLGRTVRCWEYDYAEGTWTEDGENVRGEGDEAPRYVAWAVDGEGDLEFSMMAAVTRTGTMGGVAATGLEWKHVLAFRLHAGSSGLTLAPGWTLEAAGLSEPLLLPPSGLHWEHPRVVFRVLGRRYATIRPGVVALPKVVAGAPGTPPIDPPIRMGRLLFCPEGLFITE